MGKLLWAAHVATQGSSKDVKKFHDALQPAGEKGPEEFLKTVRGNKQ